MHRIGMQCDHTVDTLPSDLHQHHQYLHALLMTRHQISTCSTISISSITSINIINITNICLR